MIYTYIYIYYIYIYLARNKQNLYIGGNAYICI